VCGGKLWQGAARTQLEVAQFTFSDFHLPGILHFLQFVAHMEIQEPQKRNQVHYKRG